MKDEFVAIIFYDVAEYRGIHISSGNQGFNDPWKS